VIVTHDSWVAKRAERRLHLKQGKVTEKQTDRGLIPA
jgi:putative ABC transport system ATP-binding protein